METSSALLPLLLLLFKEFVGLNGLLAADEEEVEAEVAVEVKVEEKGTGDGALLLLQCGMLHSSRIIMSTITCGYASDV